MPSVAHSRLEACDGTMPPVLVLVPPLEGVPLWMIICFLEAIDLGESLLEEGLVGRERDLSEKSISQ